ncbi:MAG TPA: hypothetical protein VFC15_05350, partial [Candidatus Limnocylindrales bacterium]|nr:hypothetical protein [Candidatus Limnocylindrales bacterium]
ALLVESGEPSMDLLEDAVATETMSPQIAGPCMAEILRCGHARETNEKAPKQHLGDVWLC